MLRLSNRYLPAGIILVAVVLGFTSSINDAPIVDEIPHIGAGYSYVTKLDMRLNPEHPPFIKDLAGLALLPLDLKTSAFQTPSWLVDVNGQWQFGRYVVYTSLASPDTIKMFARLPMLLVFAFACWLLWKWTRERYGDAAGLIALILLAFSPTVMAHGRLVTTDMGAAAGVLAATYCFVAFLRAPTRRSFIWAYTSLGLALLSKFNTVLLIPFFLLAAALYGFNGNLGKRATGRALRTVGLTALICAASFLLVVWPLYAIQTLRYPPEKQVEDTKSIMSSYGISAVRDFLVWGADKPVIRGATHWMMGLAMVQQRSVGGNTIFWLGRVEPEGGPWYFPIVYFIKEPLAWWILVAVAMSTLLYRNRRLTEEKKDGLFFSDNLEEWVWLLWLFIYWAISIRSTLNIGVRHLLPVFPFTIMLVSGRLSGLLDWLRGHDRLRLQYVSWAIALLLGWYGFESVRVWPYYLTYFNQIAGGPSGGHRYVADSNLDWGQDIKRLGQWLTKNNVPKVSIDYFGWADPAYYLGDRYIFTTGNTWKDADDFIKRNQSDGWIAISATFYLEAINRDIPAASTYRWLLAYEPVTVVGNSIFVWHITK